MSVEGNDPRKALFVLCLARLMSSPKVTGPWCSKPTDRQDAQPRK